MSIFDKPLSELKTEDLADLLLGQAIENLRLEFKKEVPKREETLKKLSSFANTFGGFLVIGAEADSKDGRLLALPGVDRQPSFKQTIVQWCADGIAPYLDVDVSDPISASTDAVKVCYVVCVRESELAPHFLNYRKGIYVRTNEFSSLFEARLANEVELRHLFARRKEVRERRERIIERARKRFLTFIERRYHEVRSDKQSIGARFELSIIPRFPAIPICDHTKLLSTLSLQTLEWRQVGFPRRSLGLVSQHESAIILRPGSSFSILEANVWGLLFYATEIERQEERYSGIHLNHFLGQLLVFLKHARLMIAELGCAGSLLISVRLQAICAIPWIYFEPGVEPQQGPSSELDDEIDFSLSYTSEILNDQLHAVTVDILRHIFLQ